jgi:hypothetical protein
MTGFIIALLGAVVLIAAYIAVEVWLTKKHGVPELPDDIRALDARIANEEVRLNLDQFTPDRQWLGRKTCKRTYATDDGLWQVTVELEGDIAVSYRAVLKHKKGWWLNCWREKSSKRIKPMMIVPGE